MKAVPTKKQLEWADDEIGVIIHYLMTIYNPDFEEYKTDKVRTELSPDRFNPDKLAPEQWVRSAKELGAKYAVLVVNHCDGFSLWQTDVNDYSCASMKWKDGKGDILQEFVDACKKYGIKPGVYYSTGCNGYYNINDEVKHDYTAEYYRNFVKCVERQVEEIWSRYGEFFEIWFDGGVIPVEQGGPDIYSILKKYQPDALTFQGPVEHIQNIRWVGNEDGVAPENCWGTVFGDNITMNGNPDGDRWIPAETDFPNRDKQSFGGGWGWRANEEDHVYTPEHLLDCYVKSVGRNTNMLVGMAIATDGSFQDEEQFMAFGKLLKETFGTPYAQTEMKKGNSFSISADKSHKLSYLTISENIANGHSVLGFDVKADGKKIYSGECIGHKRIIPLDGLCASDITVDVTACSDIPELELTLFRKNND